MPVAVYLTLIKIWFHFRQNIQSYDLFLQQRPGMRATKSNMYKEKVYEGNS